MIIEYNEIKKWHLLDKTRTLIYLIQQLGEIDLEATISTLNRELNILNKKNVEVAKSVPIIIDEGGILFTSKKKEEQIKIRLKKLFSNKNWSNRNNQWMISIGEAQEFERSLLEDDTNSAQDEPTTSDKIHKELDKNYEE